MGLLLDRLRWPLTVIVSVALLALAGLILGGDALGVDPEVRREILAGAKAAAAGAGALLMPLTARALARDADHDGVPDVLQSRAGDEIPPPRGES